MLIRWGALSDTGVLRVQNEDSMLAQEGLFVVADGMGGHNAGEVASAMATSMLKSAHANGIADAKELGDLIKEINVQIFQSAATKTEQSGMGTTLTALAITPSDQTLGENSVATATVANIGDSRTYLLRNGEFRQVSVDHSYVQELVSDGLITREEARTHARRNIVTRALGIEPVVGVDTWTLPLIAGDRYVLCSDGLVDEVTDADIATCLKRITDPQETANELVAMANTNGGRDNITVIVVDVLVESDKPETKPEAKSGVTKLSSSFIRKLIISTAVSIVAVVAIVFITSYIRSGYFVDYENNKPDARVLIYRGKNFMWINPTIEADSTLIRTDLSAALDKEVAGQPGFDSALEAQNFVNQIRDVVETVLSPITSTTKP